VWESPTRRPQTLRGKAFDETTAELLLPVMIVTTAGYVSTAGEV
ncbi:hypothetical protein Tco_0484117, partial [Tanacetum coccineum]